MTCEFIYFDIGNVLLSFCHEKMCRQMAAVTGIEPKRVEQFFFGPTAHQQMLLDFEAGHLLPDDFYRCFCEMAGTRPDREALEMAASDIFRPIVPMMELVKQLAEQGNSLGLLSNTNPFHWDFFTDGRYPLLASPGDPGSPFAVPVASHLVRATKPDAEIYQIAIRHAGVDAQHILFVDDRSENVAGARTAGIDAVLFAGIDEFSFELARRGIL